MGVGGLWGEFPSWTEMDGCLSDNNIVRRASRRSLLLLLILLLISDNPALCLTESRRYLSPIIWQHSQSSRCHRGDSAILEIGQAGLWSPVG